MSKLILTLDGVIVKEVELMKTRSTIGRRPYNDIVIDNLAVSGEHAVIENTGQQVILKDLGSTNGTYINGKPIRKQALEIGDKIEIGKYKIEYVESTEITKEEALSKFSQRTPNGAQNSSNPPSPPKSQSSSNPPTSPGTTLPTSLPGPPPTLDGSSIEGPRILVLNGISAGRSLALTKVVSTIGNPSVSVASIIRRVDGYDLAHVTGKAASVNGVSAADSSIALKHGDLIDVGGIELEFLEH
jgi:pSer/pThr/pTyr-binding forkhead associated (FHA) protein